MPAATVRHVLDMRSGVRFVENYGQPASRGNEMLDQWLGWRPDEDGGEPPRALPVPWFTLQAEVPQRRTVPLPLRRRPIVLGWVCERAAGKADGRACFRAGVGADGRRA